jgi:hypothetical protein
LIIELINQYQFNFEFCVVSYITALRQGPATSAPSLLQLPSGQFDVSVQSWRGACLSKSAS